jgi:hypothetical protein
MSQTSDTFSSVEVQEENTGSTTTTTTTVNNNNNNNNTRAAKNRITFFSQIIVIYAIIGVAIFHLSFQSPDKELWLVLLSSSLGYILPTPCLKYVKPPKTLGS